jgi:hypothetical protein
MTAPQGIRRRLARLLTSPTGERPLHTRILVGLCTGILAGLVANGAGAERIRVLAGHERLTEPSGPSSSARCS